MKKLYTIAVTTCALALGSLQVQAAETIRFGTEPTYPPFEFLDENNELTGFDIDLAKAICTEIKAECTFHHQPFDSLIPSLRYRRFDAVIAGMDITPARQKQVDFSTPYFENSASFVAAKAKQFKSPDDLKGKAVGVQNGSTFQTYMVDKFEKQGVTIRPYETIHNAFLDMTNGRVDAVFSDTAVANDWLLERGKGDYGHLGKTITDAEYFGVGYGIAVRHNDPLKGRIDNALTTLKKNGTWQAIHDKYFPEAK
ncbi:lysine/arginine/ornithine ABC transporter substrate-binding protein [Endozoicomonas gorgoniicola]|uniref:Lysine/arginine/ornithine ABC transporter substrate-binding protein n=1 Tax=Endozoicomonas gorgoniicola TaxID=1234144 RepID=A0ABT3MWP6_9GAMM|nr:lysine/arginine/ornithine ABC transporter substrate-binding protein [Endozoicomonas gorgoniicola]MCW7553806.1 lysine/arginine/ornithine ABC transporter substrate-binding protein [Endozoicomonas gorgoniicola]